MDYISQAGGGIADAFNARARRPSNWYQQTRAITQERIGQQYQQEMAQRAAMEQAARLAQDYEWRRYAAGQGERRQDFSEEQKLEERKLYEKMLGKEQEKGDRFKQLLAATLPMEFAQADDLESLKAMSAKALRETQGDPALMNEVRLAEQKRLADIIRSQKPGTSTRWLEKVMRSLGAMPSEESPMPAPAPAPAPYGRIDPYIPNWPR